MANTLGLLIPLETQYAFRLSWVPTEFAKPVTKATSVLCCDYDRRQRWLASYYTEMR